MMIVMDSFALPVEGTETRVNAQAQAYEYMTAYIEAAKQVCLISERYLHSWSKSLKISLTFEYRSDVLKMLSVGITAILGMGVG